MNNLRKARLKADKSQHQLMQETGIIYSTISRIERGWLNPTDEQKERLAKALKGAVPKVEGTAPIYSHR